MEVVRWTKDIHIRHLPGRALQVQASQQSSLLRLYIDLIRCAFAGSPMERLGAPKASLYREVSFAIFDLWLPVFSRRFRASIYTGKSILIAFTRRL
jgi:hypothetical protein